MRPRILATDAAGHATELAREAVEQGADLVLVLGGDGTINEAANGLAYCGVPLGVLPAGTANVLSMELGLGSHLGPAIERLTQCLPQRIAMGKFTACGAQPRYFLCMAGAGLDAKVVSQIDPALKDRTGKLAYWTAGLAQVVSAMEQLDVRIPCDGVPGHDVPDHGVPNGVKEQTLRCGFLLVSRVRNYGGDLEIASGASLRRADFEVVLFEGSNPLRYAGYMLGVLLKQVQHMGGVRTMSARSIEILSPTHLQIDGEYAGHKPARMEIAPDALTLLMPSAYR